MFPPNSFMVPNNFTAPTAPPAQAPRFDANAIKTEGGPKLKKVLKLKNKDQSFLPQGPSALEADSQPEKKLQLSKKLKLPVNENKSI